MLEENKIAIQKFINNFAASTVSQRSIDHYSSVLKKFFDMVEKNYMKVTREDIDGYINASSRELQEKSLQAWEVKRKTLSLSYRINIFAILARFFRFHERFELYDDLTKNRPKLGERSSKLIIVLTEDEKKRLVAEDVSKNEFINARNRMICTTFYGTGIRVDELINLKVNLFEFDGNFIGKSKILKIIGKGNKEREIVLPRWVWNELFEFNKKYNGGKSEYFFFGERMRNKLYHKLTHSMIWKIVKYKAIAAGIIDKSNDRLWRRGDFV